MKRLLLLLSLCFNHLAYPEGFIAGTPVKTPTGYVPIEQIKAGDQVYSYDFNGCYSIKTVILTNKQYTEALVKITVDDESFFTTPDQFFISTIYPLKWVAAIDLKIGDQIEDIKRNCIVNEIEFIEACAEIYTLSVARYGNFAVSTHDIFAHNIVPLVVAAGPAAAPFAIAATETIATAIEAAIPYIPAAVGLWYRWKTNPSRSNVLRHSEHPYYNSSLHGNPWPKDDDPDSPWSRWNNPHAYDDDIDPNNPIWGNPQAGNDGKKNPRDSAPKATTSCGGCGGGGGKPPDDPDDPWNRGKFGSNGRPSREHIFPTTKSYEQARNQALEMIGKVDFAKSEPIIGKFGVCKGKVVGRTWHNGAVTMRLDYDAIKGPHVNVTDYRMGKGTSGTAAAIPFKGTEETVKALLKHLQ